MSYTNQVSIQILRKPEALGLLPICKSTFQSQINEGLLCSPISLGSRSVGYLEHEIREVLKARIAGKTDDEIRTLVISLEAQRKDT